MLVSWLQTLRSEGAVHIPGPLTPNQVSDRNDRSIRHACPSLVEVLLILAGTVCVAAVALSIYLNTESFQSLVRRRLVAEVERVTGGRAKSVASIRFLSGSRRR